MKRQILPIYRKSRALVGPFGLGALAALTMNGGGAVLQLGLQTALARLLGVEAFGLYSLVISWAALLAWVGTVGLDTAAIRYIAQYRAQGEGELLNGFFRVATFLPLIASLVILAMTVVGTLVVGSPTFTGEEQLAYLAGWCLVPLLVFNTVREAVLRGLRSVAFARATVVIIRPGILLLLLFVWVSVTKTLSTSAAIWLHIVAAGAAAIVAEWRAEILIKRAVAFTVPRYLCGEWLRAALPLMSLAVLYGAMAECDRLLLGVLSTKAEVGLYTAAARLGVLILFAVQAVDAIGAPLIAERYAAAGREQLQLLLNKISAALLLLASPIVLCLIGLGPSLLGLFGDGFRAAYPTLLLLIFGQSFVVSCGSTGFLLTMTGNHRRAFPALIVALVVNILVGTLVIPFFGALGAAFGSTVALIVRSIILQRAVYDTLKVDASVAGGILNLIRARRVS